MDIRINPLITLITTEFAIFILADESGYPPVLKMPAYMFDLLRLRCNKSGCELEIEEEPAKTTCPNHGIC